MGESIFPMKKCGIEANPDTEVIPFSEAETVLEALASETARTVLRLLQNEPLPPSELAEKADISLQNLTYHLNKLENAGLVEPVATHYSSRGVEMDIYAPAADPAVICIGGQEELRTTSRTM